LEEEMDARIGPAAPRRLATTADDDGVRVAAGSRAPAKEDLRRLDAVVAMAQSFLLHCRVWKGLRSV
jgi:hypothetical protein